MFALALTVGGTSIALTFGPLKFFIPFWRWSGEKTKKPRIYHTQHDLFTVWNLAVEPSPVSHSLEGATAYILYTCAGSIVYTGDSRFRGYKGELTKKFTKRATEIEPSIMLCEGTRVNSTQADSEEEVKQVVQQRAEKTDKLVIANFRWETLIV
jgi:mRNA degradation ribonuclease J1/J2